MLNMTTLVGRITKDPEIIETETGAKYSNICVAVPRPFKNVNGEYETDFIDVTIFNNVAEKTAEYVRKGDIVGIKGRIQVDSFEKDGEKRYATKVIADSVSFLASKTKEEPAR